ncbi:hypothetical protein BKA82DRAFT_377403 [Pisolithus tinctorius]|uniref:Uncharacterized protein n=1 Tax=Pisolithus tinctorius Marx 270 TaxID=870435 RepID=A0A0C3PIL4_PISTI|nr:hypothetical protein BKA82DRAFT_377403 [Pisolithus tinctorius]KIO07949.1 hypothetical protein M404DRAFT_377403 [Pisolithus tinctorius Marx 270]
MTCFVLLKTSCLKFPVTVWAPMENHVVPLSILTGVGVVGGCHERTLQGVLPSGHTAGAHFNAALQLEEECTCLLQSQPASQNTVLLLLASSQRPSRIPNIRRCSPLSGSALARQISILRCGIRLPRPLGLHPSKLNHHPHFFEAVLPLINCLIDPSILPTSTHLACLSLTHLCILQPP